MQRLRKTPQIPDPSPDLERAADALLDQVLPLGSASGLYSQKQLDRKIRHEATRMPRLSETAISAEMADLLVERRVAELVDAANLTAVQEILYRLHVAGVSTQRMASSLGIKHRIIEQRLKTAKRRVKAAYREGRYAGWYEVYLSEVNRPAYRRRK